MRAVLENSEEDFIPLSKEIELLQKYTKLEHFRFQDKFDYDILVDDAIPTDQFKIPPMLLQPYIENAVWHGLRYKEDKGNLLVHFQLKDEHTVVIIIEDDGIGRAQSKAIKTDNQKKQKSQGMSNIQRRISILNDMYSDTIAIAISDKDQTNHTGTRVAVTLKKH
jgi:LytS/YehU family sensor histidine kinase